MTVTWNLSWTKISDLALQTVIRSSSHASCNHLLVYSMSKDDRNIGMAKVFCMLFGPQFPLFPFPKLPPWEFVLSQWSLSCPSAMIAVWEVGVGFLGPMSDYVVWGTTVIFCNTAHRLHTLAWGGGDPWSPYLVQGYLLLTVPPPAPTKSYCLCVKPKQIFKLHVY